MADFPALDQSPDPSLALSQQFLNSIDLSDVPDIPQTDGTCSGSAEAAANAAANHWVRVHFEHAIVSFVLLHSY